MHSISAAAASRKTLLALVVSLGVTACGGSSDGDVGGPYQADGNTSSQSSSDTTGNDPDVDLSDDDSNPDSDADGSDVDDTNGSPSDDEASSDSEPEALRVEAEDYDDYYDNTPVNEGGAYRSDGVGIETTTDEGGGYNIGWTEPGEWLEYEVMLAAGTYEVTVRVASEVDQGAFTLSLNGQQIGALEVANTGNWQAWETKTVGELTIESFDIHSLRLQISGGDFNLNWIDLVPVSSDGAVSEPGEGSGSSSSDAGGSDSSDASDSGSSSSSPPSGDYAVGGYVPDYDPDYTPESVDGVMPLFHQGTPLEAVITYETEDALITRFSDRGRDRHAKEDQFQAYDHYLSFYWEDRTAAIEIVDKVAKGGNTIRMNVRTEFRLNDMEAENRWFYTGRNTVAEFCDNGTMEVVNDLNYYKERSHNCRKGREIQMGDKLEFEISQFLAPNVPNGRAAYYGTTYLYIVGEGIVPWDVGGATPAEGIKDSVKIPESAWLGGDTTIHANTSGEPHNRFMQMATNLGYENAQPFVKGRRILHTSFVDGTHDERPEENPIFEEMVGKSGPRYINESCSDCHVRNGRAVPEAIGEHLDKWVFRVGDEDGNAHPYMGAVMQPQANSGADSEGQVFIASWTEEADGLRSPNYEFTGVTPERFSGRIAPPLVGMGLLEAIPEEAILANEDPEDASGNGISGRAHRVVDPASGETRLGRFGWKAGKVSIEHQVVSALNTDMGVMTSVLPDPDCGSEQTDCGPSGSQLDDEYVDDLVKYIALLGVPPQRDWDSPAVQSGEALFDDIGCAGCHTPSFQTSEYHPLAELRNQTIYPYSDLLLHDMGPGLADSLGEGDASGSEWRTTPLWGLGHSACVTGGMTNAGQGDRVCTPEEGYLHDGRARTIEEAILWHGGEGQASRDGYQALSQQQKDDLLSFLESL